MYKKIEFINTDVLSSVNWDKEIATFKTNGKPNGTAKHLSSAVTKFNLLEHYLRDANKETPFDEQQKSNAKRILEYLYGKFIYHHARYYDKGEAVDLKKLMDEAINYSKYSTTEHFQDTFKSEYTSGIPVKEINNLSSILYESYIKNLPKIREIDESMDMFKTCGLVVNKTRGIKDGDRDSFEIMHDGVKYHLYLMKSENLNAVERKIDNYREFVNRYHQLIKEVRDKIQKIPGVGKVWVMDGGGAQHQAFFGNKNGYLGILYLDLRNSKLKEDNVYDFIINGNNNDDLLKDLKHPRIKVVTSFSIYGKD